MRPLVVSAILSGGHWVVVLPICHSADQAERVADVVNELAQKLRRR